MGKVWLQVALAVAEPVAAVAPVPGLVAAAAVVAGGAVAAGEIGPYCPMDTSPA